MRELGSSAWKAPSPGVQHEGVSYEVTALALWPSLSAKVVKAACLTPSSMWDVADCSRLVVMLAQQEARVEIGPHHRRRPTPTHDTPHQMTFGPPGARQWGFFNEPSGVLRWLVLQFDLPSLAGSLGEELEAPELRPRYMFYDPETYRLSRIIAAECASREPRSALYHDGLTLALVRALCRLEETPPRSLDRTSGLTPRQRRLLADTMRARLADPIRLKELADLVGLSPSHFCRAFKASVGMPPHAWQLRERIRAAQAALRAGSGLAEIALATGFCDQAHFTRVFSRTVGISPSAWRRLVLQ